MATACHVPLVWVHLQANSYELPDILYKASGVCVLWVVFNVLVEVEVVVICFLGRDDSQASCGQQCALTNTDQSILCY